MSHKSGPNIDRGYRSMSRRVGWDKQVISRCVDASDDRNTLYIDIHGRYLTYYDYYITRGLLGDLKYLYKPENERGKKFNEWYNGLSDEQKEEQQQELERLQELRKRLLIERARNGEVEIKLQILNKLSDGEDVESLSEEYKLTVDEIESIDESALDKSTGYTKEELRKTVNFLKTHPPQDVQEALIVKAVTVKQAETIAGFDHLRIRGEWFIVDDVLLEYIESLTESE